MKWGSLKTKNKEIEQLQADKALLLQVLQTIKTMQERVGYTNSSTYNIAEAALSKIKL